MTGLEPGVRVKCSIPGRRSFESAVIRVRPDENSVDVRDPRNGGLRTLRAEHVRPVRRRRRTV